jgi:DUF4097 and DUF4098 domain-containing protein YvlB
MTLQVIAVVLAAFTMSSTPAGSQLTSQSRVQVFNGPVAQGAWLRIRNLRGDIEVRETSGRNVVVTASRDSDSRNYGEVTFDVRRDGANVTVCAIWPRTSRCDARGYDYDSDRYSERRTGEVDFVVELPKGIKLVAATGNGAIDIRDAGAEVEAQSGNGEVTVRGAGGRVTAASGNGDLEVQRALGDVEARTGNGDIKVTTSLGPVSARTGNGEIEVEMTSVRGNDDMDFSTGNGTIDVSFPSNLSAMVEANVPYKNLETDFPMDMAARWSSRHVEGKIGNGGRRIRFNTGNGHVRIRKIG